MDDRLVRDDWMRGLDGKTIGVTGATGFIGNRLIEVLCLKTSSKVRALVRGGQRANLIGRFNVEMVLGNLTDSASLQSFVEGCDVVIHCANHKGSLKEQREINVGGLKRLAAAAAGAKVNRLIHTSSLAIYNYFIEGKLDERAPRDLYRKGDAYALAKREAEEFILDFHKAQGLSVVVIQPTIVYGPNNFLWTSMPISQFAHGDVALAMRGEGFCNLIYVDDLVQFFLRAALAEDVDGECFLANGPNAVTWAEYYGEIQRMVGFGDLKLMDDETLDDMWIEQARSVSTPKHIIQGIRSNPAVKDWIAKTPVIKSSFAFSKKVLPESWIERLRSKLRAEKSSGPVVPRRPASFSRSLHVPDPDFRFLQTSKMEVSIQKAINRLGYTPKYDLESGMAMVEQWAHWEGLITSRNVG